MKAMAFQSLSILLRFVAVGFVNTAIGLSIIYFLMFFLKIAPLIANLIGYVVGLAVSFTLNRAWTFSSKLPMTHELSRYLLVAVVCYGLNFFMVLVATSSYSINPYLAQLLGISLYTITMFLGCLWFVFVPKHSA